MARMPSCDAGARMFMMPASVNIDESAVERKKIVTRTRPASGAELGPAHDAVGEAETPAGARPERLTAVAGARLAVG